MQKWRGSAVTCVTLLTAVLVCHAKEIQDQATYDQRQNGDLNVHVHVQDVGILALLDEALLGGVGQYDYSYDYQDAQDPVQEAKPNDQERTSTVITDTSTEAASPTSTTVLSDSTNVTTTISTTPTVATECNNRTATSCANSPESSKESSQTGDKQQAGPLVAMLLSRRGSGRRRCTPGYVRDSKGRCRRQRRPSYYTLQTLPLNLPFGIQLAPRP